jgi:uncharacterized membrane protein YfcA
VAVGSNMAIGCLTGLVGALTVLLLGHGLLFTGLVPVLVAVLPPTVVGGYLGGWLTGYLSKERVKWLAGWIIALTGVLMVGQVAVPLLRRPAAPPPLTHETPHEGIDPEDFDPDDD